MAENSDQERSEEATSQRREDFRRRGQVAQTKELSSVFMLLGMALILWLMGKYFIENIFDTYRMSFNLIRPDVLRSSDVTSYLAGFGIKAAMILLPVLVFALVLAIASSVLQTGFLFSEDALSPDLEKINPLSGFKRIFSLRNLMEGIKSLAKFGVIGGVVYNILSGITGKLPELAMFSPSQTMAFTVALLFKLLFTVGIVMLVIAAADYFFQRFTLENEMKMTKQEIRDEVKTREGDPLIKARIRKIQKEVAQRRMMSEVPKADVIITNPTHIAIALKYNPEKYAAPILIAKGQDYVATKIREIAKEHGIPIVENKPLARAMFKTMELGQVIPRELFAAVAEVLAYVFKLKKKKLARI